MSKDTATEASMQRRTFLKGLGLAATAGAVGGGTLLSERAAQASQSSAPLSDSTLVMIWRRVSDLGSMKTTVSRVNGWSLIGEDGYSAMFDAGNALVSYWSQQDFLTRNAPKNGDDPDAVLRSRTAAASAGTACTIDTEIARVTAYNPSNQMTLAVGDPERTAKLLQRGSLRAATQEASAAFVDDSGNSTRYQPVAGLDRGKIGVRLQSLRDNGLLDREGFLPLVSYELLVSNVAASRAFYQNTLGLRLESEGDGEAIFNTGNVSLRIRQEESVGLVKSLRQALLNDLVVFHTDDIEQTVHSLGQAGVNFPNGIEDSSHGRLATFRDPDGHGLSVWQAPAKNVPQDIEYFPVLDRLLVSASAHAG